MRTTTTTPAAATVRRYAIVPVPAPTGGHVAHVLPLCPDHPTVEAQVAAARAAHVPTRAARVRTAMAATLAAVRVSR